MAEEKQYRGNEPVEDKVQVPEQSGSIHPLDEDYVKAQQDAENRKQSELDAAREEHNRRTAGGDPR